MRITKFIGPKLLKIIDNSDLKNDNDTFKPGAFKQICNSFFNYVASSGHPIAAGDCLLHYLCSGKKKPNTMTLRAIKLLDHYYEK